MRRKPGCWHSVGSKSFKGILRHSFRSGTHGHIHASTVSDDKPEPCQMTNPSHPFEPIDHPKKTLFHFAFRVAGRPIRIRLIPTIFDYIAGILVRTITLSVVNDRLLRLSESKGTYMLRHSFSAPLKELYSYETYSPFLQVKWHRDTLHPFVCALRGPSASTCPRIYQKRRLHAKAK